MRPHRIVLAPAAADDDAIAKSQTVEAEGPLTLDGDLAGQTFDIARRIAIDSAGNDAGITFTVTGIDRHWQTISETVTGASADKALTEACFLRVDSVVANGAADDSVKVGTADAFDTPWLPMNLYADDFNVTVSVAMKEVGGTPADFEYTLQYTTSDVQEKGFRETDAVAFAHDTMKDAADDSAVVLTNPVTAIRLRITDFAAGAMEAVVIQAGGVVS